MTVGKDLKSDEWMKEVNKFRNMASNSYLTGDSNDKVVVSSRADEWTIKDAYNWKINNYKI